MERNACDERWAHGRRSSPSNLSRTPRVCRSVAQGKWRSNLRFTTLAWGFSFWHGGRNWAYFCRQLQQHVLHDGWSQQLPARRHWRGLRVVERGLGVCHHDDVSFTRRFWAMRGDSDQGTCNAWLGERGASGHAPRIAKACVEGCGRGRRHHYHAAYSASGGDIHSMGYQVEVEVKQSIACLILRM